MTRKFVGSPAELEKALVSLAAEGSWRHVNSNQLQFVHRTGGILNFFPSTGTLQFQGTSSGAALLQATVAKLLNWTLNSPSSADTRPPQQMAEETTPPAFRSLAQGEGRHSATETQADGVSLRDFADSEIVIALVGAVGTDFSKVIGLLIDRFGRVGYQTSIVKISQDVIPQVVDVATHADGEETRISALMDAGNSARLKASDNAVLADGAASAISAKRLSTPDVTRRAFIVSSLKHPEEVLRLRQLYPAGFYLIGVHADETLRLEYLRRKGIDNEGIARLIERDMAETARYGQRVNDTFHLADFFLHDGGHELQLLHSVHRIFDVLFGHPYITPTFDEFAMFSAFTASLRSADLSRQVGAVVARGEDILSTGANDTPKYGGGLYWPVLDRESGEVTDKPDGRDYKRGEDSNRIEQKDIIDAIVRQGLRVGIEEASLRPLLEQSRIRDLTEFGRVVHAEMEAILSCARNGISTRNTQLFCTTFPCHNCAKHIVAAGVDRVVFIEPYQKSKAAEFHTDSIAVGLKSQHGNVHFQPFIGVGPRRFLDLFSLRLGAGSQLVRKDAEGMTIPFELSKRSKLRIQMLPLAYKELEREARESFEKVRIKPHASQ